MYYLFVINNFKNLLVKHTTHFSLNSSPSLTLGVSVCSLQLFNKEYEFTLCVLKISLLKVKKKQHGTR